jgi:signal peptidase I
MRRPRTVTIACGILALAAFAAAWASLAPSSLGGSTSYAVVHGVSMEPRLHEGDLVLVRPASDYGVGDIVAYRNRDLGAVVLHRIVGIHDGRYVFEGDNNGFVDSYRPQKSELVGRRWLRVPGAGRLVVWLRVPRNAALLAALAALLLVAGGAEGAARRRRSRVEEVPEPRPTPAPQEGVRTAASALAVAAAAFALLGLLAFTRSTTRAAVDPTLYTHRGSFAYTAAAPRGRLVYGAPAVRTGQPIFLRLAQTARFSFDYAFDSRAAHSLAGSGALEARVEAADGWSRTIPLARDTAFDDDRAQLQGVLDLRRLQTLVAHVDEQTGVPNATYSLAIVPRVRVHGVVAGRAIRSTFAPALRFTLNSVELALQTASSGKPAGTLRPTQAGAGVRSEARTLALGGLRLRVATARRVAVGGLVASLLALLAVGFLLLPVRGGEAARIGARYGSWLLPVEAPPALRDVVDVVTMDALVRLAEHHDRPVLHVTSDGGDEYLVAIEEIGYRYRVGGAPELVPG